MTAKENAKLWLYAHGFRYDDETVNSLARLLKDQDRITRHACADAVNDLPKMGPGDGLIGRGFAIKACINVKAV